jgi:hypothetical protein
MREDLSITQQKEPHGMCTTQVDTINADLLAFIKS